MTEEELARLGEDIEKVRPVFDAFCSRYGFVYVTEGVQTRYPRIRIHRAAEVTIYYDLWINFGDDGRREFPTTLLDVPYDLMGGAFRDSWSSEVQGERVHVGYMFLANRPMSEIRLSLAIEMERHLPELERLTRQDLDRIGKRVRLRRG